MPNWCFNSAEISHADSAKIDELIAVAEAGTMFAHFLPVPAEVIEPTDPDLLAKGFTTMGTAEYDWRVNNWGTKWDIGQPTYVSREGPTELILNFDTAWAPPIGVFEAMKEAGYRVRSEYTEEGMAFAGLWDDGEDECYDIDDLPEHLEHLKPSDWNEEEAA